MPYSQVQTTDRAADAERGADQDGGEDAGQA